MPPSGRATVQHMSTLLRRLFWLALLGGAAYAVYTVLQERRSEPAGAPPAWPPLDDRPPAGDTPSLPTDDADTETDDAVDTAVSDRRWVPPVDGTCPEGYPIKGNETSGIYHVPGGRFYDRTVPERCYADEADAEADGYRRSKA